MDFYLVSERCGHCVHMQDRATFEQVAACLAAATGSPCILCGARVDIDDIRMLIADQDLEMVAHTSALREVDIRGSGLTAYGDRSTALTFHTGQFATALRERMYGRAADKQKDEYARATRLLLRVVAPGWGQLARELRDYQTAIRWYERAIAAEDDVSIRANNYLYLGLSLQGIGAGKRAETAFAAAVEGSSGTDDLVCAIAATELGNERKERGDVDGARVAYDTAMRTGVATHAARASIPFGFLEFERHDYDRARSLWEYGLAHGERGDRERAAYNLGHYWLALGDRKRAGKLFRIARKSREPELAAAALASLEEL